jgi:hypothetical protein
MLAWWRERSGLECPWNKMQWFPPAFFFLNLRLLRSLDQINIKRATLRAASINVSSSVFEVNIKKWCPCDRTKAKFDAQNRQLIFDLLFLCICTSLLGAVCHAAQNHASTAGLAKSTGSGTNGNMIGDGPRHLDVDKVQHAHAHSQSKGTLSCDTRARYMSHQNLGFTAWERWIFSH